MDVIADACKRLGASLRYADGGSAVIKSLSLDGAVFDYGGYRDLSISLIGRYQVFNAVTAIEAAKALREKGFLIDDTNISRACA
jgi:folylpolyglutamate synthase/dihydropteroate synthase